jgi:hypothetical protein
LAPPVDREDYPEFARFLRELQEAVLQLRMMCHPCGEWGRQVFAGSIEQG